MNQTQSELANPPTDAISSIRFAPDSLRLLVASWDKHVYLYDTTQAGGQLLNKYEHRAPVLDACFGINDEVAYTAGLDWNVQRVDLATGQQATLSTHSAGVKSVVFSEDHNILISASWDSTLHIHSLKNGAVTLIKLPNKPFSLSATASKLVVAMASRALHIYELATLAAATPSDSAPEPWQRRESSLKFMTRAVCCMPTDAGYASSSIEGRVAVEWFDPSTDSQARKYAFKCHRQPAPDGSGVDIVYPVNALAFHPKHGTFASGGGDGFVALWDGVAKRRIRQYQRYASSIAGLSFSGDGKFLAVAICPGFEDGKESFGEGHIGVFVRELGESEAMAKAKGAK